MLWAILLCSLNCISLLWACSQRSLQIVNSFHLIIKLKDLILLKFLEDLADPQISVRLTISSLPSVLRKSFFLGNSGDGDVTLTSAWQVSVPPPPVPSSGQRYPTGCHAAGHPQGGAAPDRSKLWGKCEASQQHDPGWAFDPNCTCAPFPNL